MLTDAYPPFTFAPAEYPVSLELTRGPLNRLAALFRLILVVPAYIFGGLATTGFAIFQFATWLLGVILGRTPKALYDATYAVQRFQCRLLAYLLMATSTYPWGLFGDKDYTAYHPAHAPANLNDPWAAPTTVATPVVPDQPEPAGSPSTRRVILSSSSKAILIISLVLGAGSQIASSALSISNSGIGAEIAVSRAYKAYGHQLQADGKSLSSCKDLACLQAGYRTAAQNARNFEGTVLGLNVPGKAVTAKQALATTIENLALVFENAATFTTQEQFTGVGAQIQGPANQVDTDYQGLVRALSGF